MDYINLRCDGSYEREDALNRLRAKKTSLYFKIKKTKVSVIVAVLSLQYVNITPE